MASNHTNNTNELCGYPDGCNCKDHCGYYYINHKPEWDFHRSTVITEKRCHISLQGLISASQQWISAILHGFYLSPSILPK